MLPFLVNTDSPSIYTVGRKADDCGWLLEAKTYDPLFFKILRKISIIYFTYYKTLISHKNKKDICSLQKLCMTPFQKLIKIFHAKLNFIKKNNEGNSLQDICKILIQRLCT